MANLYLGDFNGNNIVDGRDASAIATYVEQKTMCKTINPVPTEDELIAGDCMYNNDISNFDASCVKRGYPKASIESHVYPKEQPSTWTDPGVDGYKKYFYIDDQGVEISLQNEPTAPDWPSSIINKKYYYKSSDVLSGDYLAKLVTHLP